MCDLVSQCFLSLSAYRGSTTLHIFRRLIDSLRYPKKRRTRSIGGEEGRREGGREGGREVRRKKRESEERGEMAVIVVQ